MTANSYIPESRITVTYDMDVNGVKKRKELPFKQLVIGNLSLENSEAKKTPLENRKVLNITSNNIDPVMRRVGAKVNMVLENHINPEGEPISINLNVDSMKAFNPNYIAKQIPEVANLLKVRNLISELGALMDNNRALRVALANIFKTPEKLEQLKAELPNLDAYRLGNKINTEGDA